MKWGMRRVLRVVGGLGVVVALTAPRGVAQQAPRAADSAEDRACAELALLLVDQYGLPVDGVAVLSGCRQMVAGAWFLPTGSDDPRLPGGPPLNPDEAARTAELRDVIVAQLAGFARTLATVPHPGLPGGGGKTLLDAVYELYDPVKHARYGHRNPDVVLVFGVQEWYGELLADYLMNPSHLALSNYVVWWGLRRQAAFPESVCMRFTDLECTLMKQALDLDDWPWPWDLADPLTLDEHLDWALANGYVPR